MLLIQRCTLSIDLISVFKVVFIGHYKYYICNDFPSREERIILLYFINVCIFHHSTGGTGYCTTISSHLLVKRFRGFRLILSVLPGTCTYRESNLLVVNELEKRNVLVSYNGGYFTHNFTRLVFLSLQLCQENER